MTSLASLAEAGVLRVAINTGNRALVQERGGELSGVSPALARRLADEIGARFESVIYAGAGKVFADAGTGAWAVAFLAVDATRAERIGFTRPYHTIEATYAVRAGDDLSDPADADQPGRTILTSVGSAYELYLSRALKHAKLEKSGTPGESFEEFRRGRADMVAGVRQSLQRAFGSDAEYRILPGTLTKVEQAMALPTPDDPRLPALDAFVARAIEEGVVAEYLVPAS
jgi:polar amino acid transport system substrate-binding protein